MSDSSIPLIGITCGSSNIPLGLQHLYGEAILRAGGRPEYLFPDTCHNPPISMLGGLLIPGGRDISPERYGEVRIAAVQPEDDNRTAFELNLLETVLKYNIPVFGICYGMQLINIYFGGSLLQDISAELPQALDHRSGLHNISVSANPYIPETIWTVNTSHHQAVKNLGDGLVPAAFSADGITEAFYADLPGFLLGVQWHPERLVDPLSDLLFERFVSACQPL